MKIHFSYQNTDQGCEARLESYANEEKLGSLTRLLQHGNYDLADLDVRVEYMPHHNNYEMKMNLKIAKHVLYASSIGFKVTEVFDLVLGKIVSQLRKLENIRHKK